MTLEAAAAAAAVAEVEAVAAVAAEEVRAEAEATAKATWKRCAGGSRRRRLSKASVAPFLVARRLSIYLARRR